MSTRPAIRLLIPSDELLRAILSNRAFANLPEAFLLRASDKGSGLSVSFDCTAAECRAQFRTTYGVAMLRVSDVRSLSLEVVPDSPTHANITGMPYKEDDPDQAEWIASQLADRATIVETGKVSIQ